MGGGQVMSGGRLGRFLAPSAQMPARQARLPKEHSKLQQRHPPCNPSLQACLFWLQAVCVSLRCHQPAWTTQSPYCCRPSPLPASRPGCLALCCGCTACNGDCWAAHACPWRRCCMREEGASLFASLLSPKALAAGSALYWPSALPCSRRSCGDARPPGWRATCRPAARAAAGGGTKAAPASAA